VSEGGPHPRLSHWWAGVKPVTVEVACGEDRHRISWRRGKLVLEDHDLAAEEAFAALGGEACLCLEVLRAWRQGPDEREVLWYWDAPGSQSDMDALLTELRAGHQWIRSVVGSGGFRPVTARVGLSNAPAATGPTATGPVSPTGAPQPIVAQIHHRVALIGGQAAAGAVPQEVLDRLRAQQAAVWRRALLSALPEELRIRLGLAAIVRAQRHQADKNWIASRAEDLQTALAGRAVPAAEACTRAWRGRPDRGHRLTVECWLTRHEETPSVYGLVDDSGGWAAVSLPLTWLVQVWARGLALVDGCLVLELRDSWNPLGPLSVVAARWERSIPSGSTPVIEPALLLRTSGGGWRLRWN